ncbi:MAG: T9SS type A sorting domain-containing protein [Bacteroidales bacterium]
MKQTTLHIVLLFLGMLVPIMISGQTPASISVSESNDGGEVAREGRVFTYTYGSWGNDCYAWGFDKSNTSLGCINGYDQPPWNCADWFTTSSSISGNVAYLNTSTTVRYITTSGSYTNGTLSARLKFTATTTGGTPINFGQNGNIIFVPVTENFKIKVEIQLYGPTNAIWGTSTPGGNPNNYSSSWESALNVFDALHTDQNYQIYTSYNNSEAGFYILPTSNTAPNITSPACGSSTTNSSVTFVWTDPCTIHSYSHYEYNFNSSGWVDNGTSTSVWKALNVGENTFRVRYYDGCTKHYYYSDICYYYRIVPNYCGDVNHGGNDWTISSSMTVAGRHYNVGDFQVNSGITATVDGSCHYFTVEAENINVVGTINANGKGESGGSGGNYGGFWDDGGYNDGRGVQWCWDKDDCRGLGQRGGYGGNSGNGTGGGNPGGTGGTGYGSKQECNFIGDEGGVVGGGGGGGAGSGGSYGGSGGAGRSGGVGGKDDAQCGNAGCHYYSEGSGGSGGSTSSTYGNSTTENINWGSGGGGAGGGGRGSFCHTGSPPHTCYSSGGSGGNGGGAVKLIANHDLSCSGAIYANGTSGANGGEGGENDYTEGCCDDLNPDCTEQTFCGPGGGGSGAGGGSGGGIMLKADCEMNFTGTMQAIGGNGGNGGNGGYSDWSTSYYGGKGSGGAGGGGGRIKIFKNPCSNNTIAGSISYAGGSGGSVASYGRAGTGSNGNNGSNGTYTNNTTSSFVPLDAGDIGNNQTICYGENVSNLISVSDASGGSCATPLYQWMQCTSGCGSPPTNYSSISGATGSTYDPGNLTQTTWFVRRVTTDACIEYTSPVLVELYNNGTPEGTWVGSTSTDWFECMNWGNGRVPTSTINVIIPSGCTHYPDVDASGAVCNRLTVQNGGSLTVSSGDLTVHENFYKQNGGTATYPGGTTNVHENYYNYGTSGETRVNGGKLNIGTAGSDKEFINYDGQLYVTSGSMDCGRYLYNYNGYANNYVNISGGTVQADRIPNYEGSIYHSGGTIYSYGYYREADAAGGNYFGSSSAIFNFNGNSYIRLMCSGSYFANVNINGDYYITTDSNFEFDINGNLDISAGNSLDMNDNNMQIAGNFTNNGTFTAGTSLVSFNGNIQQDVKTNGDSFYDVAFENTNGGNADVVLTTNDMTVTHSATFTNGIVNTGTNTFIFGASATTNAGTVTSFVDGPVEKTSAAAAFTFPTGNVNYRDIGLTGDPQTYKIWAPFTATPSASTNINVRYFFSNDNLHTWWYHDWTHEYPLTHTTDREYWLVNSSQDLDVTLYWRDNDPCPIHDFCDGGGSSQLEYLTTAYWDNIWKDAGGDASAESTINGDISSFITVPFGAKGERQITFAGTNKDIPLPVELLNFEAVCDVDSQAIDLIWSTASETNNDYFTLFRSKSSLNFEEIAKIDGHGNISFAQTYNYTDNNPPSGDVYYKLSQTDLDGTREDLNIVSVNCFDENQQYDLKIYPNPVTEELNIVFGNWPAEVSSMTIHDMSGRVILQKHLDNITNGTHIKLQMEDMAPGVYMLWLQSDTMNKNIKIEKQ